MQKFPEFVAVETIIESIFKFIGEFHFLGGEFLEGNRQFVFHSDAIDRYELNMIWSSEKQEIHVNLSVTLCLAFSVRYFVDQWIRQRKKRVFRILS